MRDCGEFIGSVVKGTRLVASSAGISEITSLENDKPEAVKQPNSLSLFFPSLAFFSLIVPLHFFLPSPFFLFFGVACGGG